MESVLGLIGTTIGGLGFVLAVFVAVMQTKEQKRNAQERLEEKERHAQELEIQKQELEWQKKEMEWQKQEMEMQKQEKARNDRLMFLADRIFDSSIPRELRQPFYEEYISMKGNGTAVRFW